jgi:hypothetical protein
VWQYVSNINFIFTLEITYKIMELISAKKEITKTLAKAKIFFYIGLLILVLAPFVLTRQSFINSLDFSNTGAIGDTIGGITAPFANILGAVLVYYALKAQIQANLTTQEQIESQATRESIQNESNDISKLYFNLKDSIDNFSFSTLDTYRFGEEIPLKGSEAIYKLFQEFYCDYHGDEKAMSCNPKITEILSMLEICNSILEKLEKSSIPDKEVMSTLTLHQFQYRIAPRINLSTEELSRYHCSSCNIEHGLPESIVQLINSIQNRIAIPSLDRAE